MSSTSHGVKFTGVQSSDIRKRDREMGISLCQSEKYGQALPLLKSVVADDPEDSQAIFYLALALLELGENRASLSYWRRLKKMGRAGKNVLLNMGCAYQNLGRIKQAILYFKEELKINPGSPEALYNLGTAFYNLGDCKSALPYLKACVALRHTTHKIVPRLADCYYKLGLLDDEIHLYEHWLQEHPDDVWGLNNLGAALMQNAEYHRAQLQLQKAAKLDPQDACVLRNLSKVRSIRKAIAQEEK